jgi:hypothetical protein
VLNPLFINAGILCFSISVALNILLTAMIVTRFILQSRNGQRAMGSSGKAGGLYKAIVTIIVESSALYTVNYLLFIASWSIGNPFNGLFFPSLAGTQVRVVFTFP